jgi:shikimate dehydrogenase
MFVPQNEVLPLHDTASFHEQPGDVVLVGLIGKGIQRSRSPSMHEEEARCLDLRLQYTLIDLDVLGRGVDALPELLTNAEQAGFAGLNITHPCKQAVIPLLHELSEEARAIGAVNTVRFENGKRVGFNTDASGFAAGFQRGLPDVPLDEVAQVGAGGAGAATAYAMLHMGAKRLTLFDSAPERAEALARNLAQFFDRSRISVAADAAAALQRAQGLVQATPTGMREHPGLPVPQNLLHAGLWIAEIVYFPLETALLRAARALGCRTVDGGGMAVFQAAAAFQIFTHRQPDRERMLRRFQESVGD